MKNTVTQAQVDAQIVDIHVQTIFDKVTVVSVRCRNGFVIVEAAGAVDKANYSESVGREICLTRIKNKLWELEGYQLSSSLVEPTAEQLRDVLAKLNNRVHSGYDFNADPDGMSLLVGQALRNSAS